MTEWNPAQARIIVCAMNRAIENTTIAKKAAAARREELDSDLILLGLLRDEASCALKGRPGGSAVYVRK